MYTHLCLMMFLVFTLTGLFNIINQLNHNVHINNVILGSKLCSCFQYLHWICLSFFCSILCESLQYMTNDHSRCVSLYVEDVQFASVIEWTRHCCWECLLKWSFCVGLVSPGQSLDLFMRLLYPYWAKMRTCCYQSLWGQCIVLISYVLWEFLSTWCTIRQKSDQKVIFKELEYLLFRIVLHFENPSESNAEDSIWIKWNVQSL